MEVSTNGLNLIKSFEGLRLKAYKCVQSERYYTIGYGHYGKDVTANMVIVESQAVELLKKDCINAIKKVNKYVNTYNFTQNEFDALVSFAFNLGTIDQLTAKGTRTKDVIAKKMLLYNKSAGVVLKGLARRRQAEQKLFLQ